MRKQAEVGAVEKRYTERIARCYISIIQIAGPTMDIWNAPKNHKVTHTHRQGLQLKMQLYVQITDEAGNDGVSVRNVVSARQTGREEATAKPVNTITTIRCQHKCVLKTIQRSQRKMKQQQLVRSFPQSTRRCDNQMRSRTNTLSVPIIHALLLELKMIREAELMNVPWQIVFL